MQGVVALIAVIVVLGTPLPSVAQARAGGATGANTTGAKTSSAKVPPQTAGPKAKPKPKEKPKAKATAKPSKKAATKPATTAVSSANVSTPAGTAPGVTAGTPTIPVVKDPFLEARLQPLLPSGMSVSDAAKGFRNWGRFVAAVHASQNLNIPFRSLKAKMTGDMPLSLGQAIQAIRSGSATPTAMVTHNRTATTASAVTQAEQQAAEDFRHVRDDHR